MAVTSWEFCIAFEQINLSADYLYLSTLDLKQIKQEMVCDLYGVEKNGED